MKNEKHRGDVFLGENFGKYLYLFWEINLSILIRLCCYESVFILKRPEVPNGNKSRSEWHWRPLKRMLYIENKAWIFRQVFILRKDVEIQHLKKILS